MLADQDVFRLQQGRLSGVTTVTQDQYKFTIKQNQIDNCEHQSINAQILS